MRILITGGHGFLGAKLCAALLSKGRLSPGGASARPIEEILLADLRAGPYRHGDDARVREQLGDLSSANFIEQLFASPYDAVFHLASLVSGGAESDFEAGISVNLDATRMLLDACKAQSVPPALVFTSSVAVYGGSLPDVVDDHTALTPQTSYGAHKAACELLIHDYSRKGFVDGRAIRLPIIIIRPGAANTAASSAGSAILREPLTGEVYDCPLNADDALYLAGARDAVACIIRAAESAPELWGDFRAVMMPGRRTTPGDMVAVLADYGGEQLSGRVHWKPEPFIRNIVNAWPTRFESTRALRIGLAADSSFSTIISDFLADDDRFGKAKESRRCVQGQHERCKT